MTIKISLHVFLNKTLYCLIFLSGFFITANASYHLFNIESNSEEGETGSMGIDVPRLLVISFIT